MTKFPEKNTSAARLFCPTGSFGKSPPSKLRAGAGTVTCGSETDFLTSEYAIVFVFEGTGTYTDKTGKEYPLRPGSIFQRFPNQPHSIQFHQLTKRCYAAVPAEVYQLLVITGTDVKMPVFPICGRERLLEAFLEIIAILDTSDDSVLMTTLTSMQQFLTDILTHRRVHQPLSKEISRACEQLTNSCDTSIDLKQLAKEVGLNYSTFRKKFRKQTGISPGDFRIKKRTEAAMKLLSETDKPIKSIANQLGFYDVYAFSRQFKNITGETPGRWKKRSGTISNNK